MARPPTYTLPALREVSGGVLIKVRAAPRSSREEVTGLHGDALKVAVRAPPEDGKANAAVASVLARGLGVREARVKIHSGAASREKWFFLEGVTPSEVKRLLEPPAP